MVFEMFTDDVSETDVWTAVSKVAETSSLNSPRTLCKTPSTKELYLFFFVEIFQELQF
jgi:hypothetical protein